MNKAIIIFLLCSFQVNAKVGSRLKGSGAVVQIEGSSGSGLIPWATIAGYGETQEDDFVTSLTFLSTPDYKFNMKSLTWGWNNRLELSMAKQSLALPTLGTAIGLPDAKLKQDVLGAKIRLVGNLIYTSYPQISLGIQYKRNSSFMIPSLIGAQDKLGIDIYLSATKMFLAKPFGFNGFTTLNLRSTKSNEIGFLGFGGDINKNRKIMVESSIGLFIKDNLALGFDFREKKSNLTFSKESHWKDVFIAWLPNKHLSLVVAYADLGTIATLPNQKGLYFSISGVL